MGSAGMAAARDAVPLLGLPGRGKTTLAEQLAADVTTGRLGGQPPRQTRGCPDVSYEDTINVTFVPRSDRRRGRPQPRRLRHLQEIQGRSST